ncbi:phosphatidylserine decarboxylase family protein [Dysgonomonas sp. 37-18]|uniref:phosphatidylserine decarboxylase family protein n=1 Tax=Dysgonomonas sp. 37-18 TaxID=1895907 RepID=UPI000929A60D|nr:phosphatidylserine decarboxylase family protein [Dysgonomonas sp. 37-18]OJX59534.1 MAG: phosphatidylserine decarboxylase [Dysgonomonas sp. 37-18]
MNIHQAGRISLINVTLVLVLINTAGIYFINDAFAVSILIVVSIIIWCFTLNFYRSPKRVFDGDIENSIVSPADGKIVSIEEVYEPEFFKDERLLVSVFMSVFNVHANWYPVDNVHVIYKKHHRGRFRAAYLPKSSTENERSTIVLEREDGQQILVRQIAGAMARRIVTYPETGGIGKLNDHFGFIKLGSRVDMYLPLGTEIKVEIGQKVIGCKTLIAVNNIKNNEAI